MQKAAQNELEEMFERIDENGDRRISFEEFVGLRLEMDHLQTRILLRQEFDAIDLDKDGHVSFAEFSAWVAPQGACCCMPRK